MTVREKLEEGNTILVDTVETRLPQSLRSVVLLDTLSLDLACSVVRLSSDALADCSFPDERPSLAAAVCA